MKANQKFSNNDEAQVGIGTMIVFIATILVAAVAAGVLIDTSQKLQSKSTQTGDAATEQVGSSLQFQNTYGLRTGGAGDIIRLELWIQPAAGADPIDLDSLIITYRTAGGTTVFQYEDNSLAACAGCDASNEEFAVYDDDGVALATDRVIEAGERAMILIGQNATLVGTSLALGTNTEVTVTLIPSIGISVEKGFDTPATYNDKNVFAF